MRRDSSLTEQASGLLDGGASNAGVSSYSTSLGMPDEDWERILNVNLFGAFYCGQEFARWLVRAERPGSIVNGSLHGGQARQRPFPFAICGCEVRRRRPHPRHGP